METQIEKYGDANNVPQVPRVGAMAGGGAIQEIESNRAVEEVRASMIMAKRFPRNEIDAETRIMQSCKRYSFAEAAVYSYPRGGQTVRGPSIRMAEVLAQHWGNLQFGIREIEKREGSAIVEAYCHDLESNVRQSRSFTVDFKLKLRDGKTKLLSDPREQYELAANYGMRRVRACILSVIPGDIVEKATKVCEATIAAGDRSEPLIDRVKRMVGAFAEIGVTKEQIEKRLGHSVEQIIPKQIVDLQTIYASVRDGASDRRDWFDFGKDKEPSAQAEKLNELLSGGSKRMET